MNPDAAELPLRDIHAAAALGWWPPAPGWWVLALLTLLLAVWLARQLRARHRVWRLKRALKAKFGGILSHYESNRDGNRLLADSATFLRRLLIHIGPYQSRAGVVGEAWATYLGKLFPGDEAMQLLCIDLANSAYKDDRIEVDPDRLRNLASHWIDRCVIERQASV